MVENNAIIQELAENTVIIQTSMYILHRANTGKKTKAIIKAVVENIVNTQSVENNAIIQTVVEINTIIQAVMENIDIIQAVLENKAIIHSMLDRHHTSSGEKNAIIQAVLEIHTSSDGKQRHNASSGGNHCRHTSDGIGDIIYIYMYLMNIIIPML